MLLNEITDRLFVAAFSTCIGTTFQPKTPPKYLLIELCQTKTM